MKLKHLLIVLLLLIVSAVLFADDPQLNTWGFTKPPVGTPVNWGDPITSGLVFFAPMNDKGNQFTYDIAKGKKGVASTSATMPTWAPGRFEGPSTAYVNANSASISFGNYLVGMSSFTFGCWVKSSTSAVFNICFMNLGHVGSGTGCVFELWAQISSNLLFRFQTRDDGGTFLNATGGAVSSTVWQHVVGVRKGSTTFLYVNGIQVDTQTGTQSTFTPADFCIGSDVVTGSDRKFLTGNVDMPFVFNRALSKREIRKLYEEPMCLFAPRPTMYQRMRGAAGNLIRSFGQIF